MIVQSYLRSKTIYVRSAAGARTRQGCVHRCAAVQSDPNNHEHYGIYCATAHACYKSTGRNAAHAEGWTAPTGNHGPAQQGRLSDPGAQPTTIRGECGQEPSSTHVFLCFTRESVRTCRTVRLLLLLLLLLPPLTHFRAHASQGRECERPRLLFSPPPRAPRARIFNRR
jgi:hypothetical protein